MKNKRDVLSPKIIDVFLKKTNIKKEQSVRDYVSKIKNDICPGATQNAAAFVAAKIKDFSVAKYVSKEDKEKLPNNISQLIISYKERGLKIPDYTTKKTKKKTYKNIIEEEAYKNSIAYKDVYILENELRELIIKKFENEKDWWKNKVPTDVKEHYQEIKSRESNYKWLPIRSEENQIYYINLEHLLSIICKHWNTFSIKVDQEKFKTWINEIIPIRHRIAHNVKIRKNDAIQIKLNLEKILRVI